MSIRVEIMADSVAELVDTLRQMAETLLNPVSANALDTSRQITDADTASSGDLGEVVTAGSVKRRGRPPKAKDDISPEPSVATPDEAPDVSALVDSITEHFKNGDEAKRKRIRDWRDSIGITLLKDLQPEQADSALALLAELRG